MPYSPVGHFVQIYNRSSDLIQYAADFFEPDLRSGHAAVAVLTGSHRPNFLEALRRRDLPVDSLRNAGQLLLLDADSMLARILVNGRPDWQRFRSQIGELIKDLTWHFPKILAFGEMVNLLWHRGHEPEALTLEGFWNRLQAQIPFDLLCGYSLDLFDGAVYSDFLLSVCHAHSHVAAGSQSTKFDIAVQRAIDEVLDAKEAAALQFLLSRHLSPNTTPLSLQTLIYLNRHMPHTAKKVLRHAQVYYEKSRESVLAK